MLTLPQKLEAIRAVCVKVNPERKWKEYACSSDGVEEEVDLPILLSDVLAAYDKAGKLSWTKDQYGIVHLGHDATELILNWSLIRPSLEDQEEATISLIYEILC